MREILFRGKTPSQEQHFDDGEWVEGYYVNATEEYGNGERTSEIISLEAERIYSGEYTSWKSFDVYESTICQFTGLYDKNRNKIWENDIVKYLEDGEIYKCNWDVGNCEYMLCNEEHSFGLGYCIGEELEVLGNTFDNPELLGGGE